MYLDSTAILPLLLDQAEAPSLARRIEQAQSPFITSPISVLEAAVGLSHATGAPIAEAHDLVKEFMILGNIRIISITPELCRRATEVYAEHGTKASDTCKLDIDEAMIYACAKANRARLLFTGNRFSGVGLD